MNNPNKIVSKINQKYYEDIVDSMPGHVYWKDKDGAFLGCNLEQARDAGFKSSDEMIGKTDYDMPWSIQADYLREIDTKIMDSGRPVTVEEIFELPDGMRKIYLSKKLPLYDDENQVSGILGISFDITDRKKLEEELVKAKELAESASRAKTEFLENMRHDIRTPLTGIVGFAEIIKMEAKNPKIKEYTDNLVAASTALLEFLNQVLEAVKVLTGDLPTVKRKFSLRDASTRIIQLLKPKALEKKLKLIEKFDEAIPNFVVGDPTRIQRILLELISNALNFTEKGSVTIGIELAKKEERTFIIRCVVEDTGVGIPPDKQDEIFLRFKRLTPSYEGIYKGAGLGLAVLKQFVDDMGGEIYCESKVGQGSKFICLIPFQEALLDNSEGAMEIFIEKPVLSKNKSEVEENDEVEESNQNHKTRILIVEDQAIAAKVAKAIIEQLACSADIAENGLSALKYAEENAYDLIFMDIGLPDINGCEVTKIIRSKEWKLERHIPIIALTAHIDTENKQLCLDAGMNAVLSKPLGRETAEEIINAFIPSRKSMEDEEVIHSKEEKISDISEEEKVIDWEGCVQMSGGDEDMVREMLSILSEDLVKTANTLEKFYQVRDIKALRAELHRTLGGVVYMRLPKLEHALKTFQTAIKAESFDFKEWERTYENVKKVINEFWSEWKSGKY